MTRSILPALDAHAHIAPDVTPAQIAALGQSVVFAMTRSLDEARQVRNRRDPALVWGVGVHPGVAAERAAWDSKEFTDLLGSFALVGEIGRASCRERGEVWGGGRRSEIRSERGETQG